jgi:hypothetical protein
MGFSTGGSVKECRMLQAAATKVDITPAEDQTVELLGYGDQSNPVYSYSTAHPPPDGSPPRPDRLHARILALRRHTPDGPGQTAVLVGLDCCYVTEKPVTVKGQDGSGVRIFQPTLPLGTCERWARAAGVDGPSLWVHPTHTHYAPALTQAMADEVTAAIRALHQRDDWTPVTVHGVVVESRLCRSRLPDLVHSPVDRGLVVWDFRDAAGRSVAHLVNLGVHPTFLGDVRATSADFVGVAMTMLEGTTPGISLFLQGWSGDVEPNYGLFPQPAERSYGQMTQMARWLGEETLRALGHVQRIGGDALDVARLQRRFPVKDAGLSDEVTFMGLAIGRDAFLVAVSGEMYQDYGPILTEYSRAVMPSCGLTNGYGGYVPTARGFGISSYETRTTPFARDAESHVRAAFRDLFAILRAGDPLAGSRR